MDIFAALMLFILSGIFWLTVAWFYYLYDKGWKEDEANREKLKQRLNFLEAVLSRGDDWRKHYTWRVEQIENRLKKLEPSEAAE
jgi:hypothetical protein